MDTHNGWGSLRMLRDTHLILLQELCQETHATLDDTQEKQGTESIQNGEQDAKKGARPLTSRYWHTKPQNNTLTAQGDSGGQIRIPMWKSCRARLSRKEHVEMKHMCYHKVQPRRTGKGHCSGRRWSGWATGYMDQSWGIAWFCIAQNRRRLTSCPTILKFTFF